MLKAFRHFVLFLFSIKRNYFVFPVLLLSANLHSQITDYVKLQNEITIISDTSNCDNILNFLDHHKSKKTSVNALVSLTRSKCYLKDANKYDTIPFILTPIIGHFKKQKDSLSQYLTARSLEIKAHYFYRKSNSDSAIHYLSESSLYYLSSNNPEAVFYNYNMAGTIYQILGSYGGALNQYFNALDLFDNYNIDSIYYVDLLIDIGVVYKNYKVYQKSIEIYKHLLELPAKLNSGVIRGDIYNNLGINYFSLDSLERAQYYFERARDIYSDYGSIKDLSRIYHNLASIEDDFHHNYSKALDYYNKSIKIKEVLNDKRGLARTYLSVAKVYFKNDSLSKSEYYALKSLDINAQLKSIEELSEIHFFLTTLYKKKGDYIHALDHSIDHKYYSDSLLSIAKEEQVKELENKFQLETKLAEVQRLAQEKEYIEERLIINRTLNIVVIVAIIILLGFFVYYIYVLKNNQRIKNAIHQKNLSLTSFSSLVKGQEEERKRLAQDLHDGVGNSLALLNIKIKQNENENALKLVSNISNEIRSISHNLMPDVLDKLGLKESLKELCNSWSDKDVLVDLQYNLGDDVLKDKPTELTIYRIIQELIKNAVDRGKASYISIQFKDYTNHYLVIVEDNGEGISENSISDGIGIRNIKSRVDYLNAKLSIESDSDGTSFYITIPKKILADRI